MGRLIRGMILSALFGAFLAAFGLTVNHYQFWILLVLFQAYGISERYR